MPKAPRVSIIMPTFGRTDFLSESIGSVFRQTFQDFEFILVDDNNPDSEYRQATIDIIRRHQAIGRSIKYIQHEKNKNGAAARNTGIAHSEGEFISFIDSDDFYLPTRLEKAIGILDGTKETVGGVYTGIEFRRGGKTYNTFSKVQPGRHLVETLACRFMIGTGSNLFLRRSAVERLEGFDERFLRHQDYEFLVRFFVHYEMAAIPEILVIKNNENFNLPPFRKSLDIRQKYLEKYRDLVDSLPVRDKNYIFLKSYSSLGELAVREGLRKDSSRMYELAQQYGSIPPRDNARRLYFWLKSLVHRHA